MVAGNDVGAARGGRHGGGGVSWDGVRAARGRRHCWGGGQAAWGRRVDLGRVVRIGRGRWEGERIGVGSGFF